MFFGEHLLFSNKVPIKESPSRTTFEVFFKREGFIFVYKCYVCNKHNGQSRFGGRYGTGMMAFNTVT
jgi:hypothetical protein